MPLNLENRLPYPAIGPHRAQQRQARLPRRVGDRGDARRRPRPPPSTCPVKTRASGAFPLNVDITSADGTLPVATTRYTVRSTAISGVGLVLSIGAGLFLLVWWARHFRTGPPRPQAGGVDPPRSLRHRPGWLRSARHRPNGGPMSRVHIITDSSCDLTQSRDRRARHRRRAAQHPLRQRRVHRPRAAERRGLLRQDGLDRPAARDRGALTGTLRAGVPRRRRRRCRRHRLHQPLGRPLGHRAVGAHRGEGLRRSTRHPGHRQPVAHRRARHDGARRRRGRRRGCRRRRHRAARDVAWSPAPRSTARSTPSTT